METTNKIKSKMKGDLLPERRSPSRHGDNPRVSHKLPKNQRLLKRHAGHDQEDTVKLLQVA